MELLQTGIYELYNDVTNRTYIGRCQSTFANRWSEHTNQLNKGKHINTQLQADWTKYGSKAFTFRVVERCDVITAKYRELEIIDNYRKLQIEVYNVYSMRDDIILELNEYTHTTPLNFESEIDLVDARCRGKKLPLHWQFYVKSGQVEIYIHLYDSSKYVDKMQSLELSLTNRAKFIQDNNYFEISKDVSEIYLTGEWKTFSESLINEIDFIVSIFG